TPEGERLRRLRAERRRVQQELLARLTPWERVQLSRHPDRPSALDYLGVLCRDLVELHGDRRFGEDGAIVGGLARFRGHAVVVVAQQRGHTTAERVRRNFGMPRPEGYRKAVRLFELAERFARPVITLVDTQGAYPGIGAEERGQAEAIAASLRTLAGLRVPVVSAVIGEGGSGGAARRAGRAPLRARPSHRQRSARRVSAQAAGRSGFGPVVSIRSGPSDDACGSRARTSTATRPPRPQTSGASNASSTFMVSPSFQRLERCNGDATRAVREGPRRRGARDRGCVILPRPPCGQIAPRPLQV